MKFCLPHWDELREAIRLKGLSHLVASSGEAAMERIKAELEGTETLANYDPLMSAYWMICSQAIEVGGPYLLSGSYCPLCELDKHATNPDGSVPDPSASKQWIEGCTKQVQQDCINMGLRPKPV
ncbi:MAG: hypothetical protein A2V66_01620 [Ignavibacteria bacterium RBG_13_36_8]|nr:MAG: hypothetical protein A2V66_01620 [Ignavibacteria bacterium RBG_13_36_8]